MRQFLQSFWHSKGPSLFGTMALGVTLQYGSSYTFLIKYAVMVMLLLSLLDCRVSLQTLLQPGLLRVVGMMGLIAIATASLLQPLSPELAIVALLLALTPTATAAPVVTRFLQGRVDYVMASVVLTNGLVALVLPMVLPWLGSEPGGAGAGAILRATLMVVGLPLLASQLLRLQFPAATQRLTQYKALSFYIWLLALYLASAKAGQFIRQESGSFAAIGSMAAVALGLCVLNFGVGRWMGRSDRLIQETGQSLGQKNTMFSVWICLTFLSPHLALGPMFYILFQNLYNAYLMARSPNR